MRLSLEEEVCQSSWHIERAAIATVSKPSFLLMRCTAFTIDDLYPTAVSAKSVATSKAINVCSDINIPLEYRFEKDKVS